jgi:hypothetical protein
MATTTPTRKTRFSRRVPDHVTDELVNVLSKPETYEFNTLFGLVYDNLKLKNAVSGGEEMLRLRSYEKLQNLVSRGLCAKVGKTYRGLEGLRAAHNAAIAARSAAVVARTTLPPLLVNTCFNLGRPAFEHGGPFAFRV